MTAQAQRVHHPYSPSTLQNREACPCFAPRNSSHHRAIAGTLAHRVVESGVDESELSDDDAINAAECADFVSQRAQLLHEARNRVLQDPTWDIIDRGLPPEILELRECYLAVDDCVFEDCKATTAGYVDHVLIDHTRTYAEIFDYKFGVWEVERAENNLQGIAYSLGLFREYPSIQKIRFWFKQPALDLTTYADFGRARVGELYLRVQTVVARARAARLDTSFSSARPFVPVCNFCDNLGRCPKVAEFACRVGSKFSPLQIPADITPSVAQDPRNTLLGLQLAQVLKVWSEAFRRQVTDRVLRRDAELPDGYVISGRSGNRSITDLGKFREIALRYITQSEYESTLESSFTTLEKIISDKAPRGSKKSAVAEFQKSLEDAGCVSRADGYSFLKAVNKTSTEKQ